MGLEIDWPRGSRPALFRTTPISSTVLSDEIEITIVIEVGDLNRRNAVAHGDDGTARKGTGAVAKPDVEADGVGHHGVGPTVPVQIAHGADCLVGGVEKARQPGRKCRCRYRTWFAARNSPPTGRSRRWRDPDTHRR